MPLGAFQTMVRGRNGGGKMGPAVEMKSITAVFHNDDEDDRNKKRKSKRRVAAGVITNNRRIICLLSSVVVLLPFLVYIATCIMGNQSSEGGYYPSWSGSFSSGIRYGLGAGDDTTGELNSALQRKGDGRAAVAIIRVIEDDAAGAAGAAAAGDSINGINRGSNDDTNNKVRYLVQLKSHDYPIEAFRGTVCLLGGNANDKDGTPLDTLKRELNEELYHPIWVSNLGGNSGSNNNDSDDDESAWTIVDVSKESYSNYTHTAPSSPGSIRYIGTSIHFQSSTLIHKPTPYAFLCALYEITISTNQLPPSVLKPRGANVREGRTVLLTEEQLVQHSKYAWGYEYTIEKYFGRNVVNKQVGAAVSIVDDRNIIWTPGKK